MRHGRLGGSDGRVRDRIGSVAVQVDAGDGVKGRRVRRSTNQLMLALEEVTMPTLSPSNVGRRLQVQVHHSHCLVYPVADAPRLLASDGWQAESEPAGSRTLTPWRRRSKQRTCASRKDGRFDGRHDEILLRTASRATPKHRTGKQQGIPGVVDAMSAARKSKNRDTTVCED
ncbi:hypothetical protein K491DRAFT_118965 [Lophiostoma macrostomum CBS 122681]|uniref:Uncharacterized protein n=1 Tax=Lophiostoma macrostomum CBS 122681 TaxID=1314788 RepID=A0A6A6SUL2_9PLEO|nr:hypothetical protein K491DRAFT_118965 [Lophiostoma macrostomum CBS 122681]